jgi:hypothetical protein
MRQSAAADRGAAGVRRGYRARMPPNEPVPVAYVALCLRLRRLVPTLVEAGAADPAAVRAVAAEPVPRAVALVREAGRLAAALPDAGLDPERERFLAGQLRAVEWRARRLAGQCVPFDVELRECLDVTVAPGEPDVYRAAHRELAALLPGPGPVADRLAAHRRRDALPPDRLGVAVRALSGALRDRVAARYGLPPDETVDHRLVADAPWSALHTYRGGYRSVVRVNAGTGLGAGRLPRLVAHETYPGHHTECGRTTLAARGRAELTVTVLGSPWTVVSEGLAECGLNTAVGAGWGRWGADILASVGVVPEGSDTDGDRAERLDAVLATLRRARQDAALLLHGDGPPTAAAVAAAEAHLRRWLLLDTARARRVVDALARPLHRVQVVASVEGASLVGAWLAGADPVTEHLRLLDDPRTPGTLRNDTTTLSA